MTTIHIEHKNWREYEPVCFYVMKACIDKFISKNKKVPIKLLEEYKKVSVKIREHVKLTQKIFEESNKHSNNLTELFRYVYKEYKNDTDKPFLDVFTIKDCKLVEIFKDFDFNEFIKTQEKSDIGFSYNQHNKEFCRLNKTEITDEFKRFKCHIKNGDMQCTSENKQTHTLGSSKYYSMCFKELPLNNNIDYGSIHVFNYHIVGFVYYFNNKKNRDAMFDYVNK
jgi:hypothetical protein